MKFRCGCEFDESSPLELDINRLPQNCIATWDMICDGYTVGGFQLGNASNYARETKPRSIMELSDLVAIIRPACTESFMDDGKNLTYHYIQRKNGLEEVEFLHPALAPILADTYGIGIYQEQYLRIGSDLAGLSLEDADYYIRTGIGKKKPAIIAEAQPKLLQGFQHVAGLSVAQAEELFEWIRAGQRYAFNLAHAYKYAQHGYLTMYMKAHFPHEFIVAYLNNVTGQEPYESINVLVNEARRMNIAVNNPDFRDIQPKFYIKNNEIYFGFTCIKDIGKTTYEGIKSLNPSMPDNWLDTILDVLFAKTGKTKVFDTRAVNNLIVTGAFDYLGLSREQMRREYKLLGTLTDREINWFQENKGDTDTSVVAALETIYNAPVGRNGGTSNKNRHKEIGDILAVLTNNPTFSLEDDPTWIAEMEKELLGVSLTYSKIDECDITAANCTVKQFIDGTMLPLYFIAGVVDGVREITIKNGQNRGKKMAFLSLTDNTGLINDAVLFSECWHKYQDFLTKSNTIVVQGKRDRKRNSLIVDKCWQV